MGKFFAGFVVASVLWGGAGFAYKEGLFDEAPPPEPVDEAPEVEEEEEEAPTKMRRRRRGRRGRRGMSAGGMYAGVGDDDLGENDPRTIDGAGSGGEEQLSNTQIEAGFDAVFPRIRRCLVLVEGEASGRVTFGLRIASSGQVTRVNLRGPSAVTQGEAGGCLRTAARGMRLPSFDGPDMIVHYPLTLE